MINSLAEIKNIIVGFSSPKMFFKLHVINFCRYLRNVSVEGEPGKPNIEFTQDGVLKAAELKIMNLRPGVSKQLVWEEVSDFLLEINLFRTKYIPA